MWIYEGHLGSLYASDTYLDYDDLYCEQCGDSDWLIGYATNRAEAWNLLKDDTDTYDAARCANCSRNEDDEYCDTECDNYSGGWNYEYVMGFINANWDE